MAPRVALIAPFAFPSVRGNAITVGRIARGLRARGVDLGLWDLSTSPEVRVEAEVAEFRPTMIHAFHAYRTGPLALRLARRAEIPLIVTITGTDGNHDLFDPERARTVKEVLEGAARITVFHESMTARLAGALPGLEARIEVVPQSASFEEGSDAFEEGSDGGAPVAGPRRGAGPVLLFPAGIRMVKNPRFPLEPLDRVVPRYPGLELLYVGPVLDPEEGEALSRALGDRPWARHLGAVPHHQVRALLEECDIVLNCSLSEGGMANSVLEALMVGRAVLASDIEGNRSLIVDGITGFLFSTREEFSDKVSRLLADRELRRRLGEAGRQLIMDRYTPARELDGYLTLYEGLATALRDA